MSGADGGSREHIRPVDLEGRRKDSHESETTAAKGIARAEQPSHGVVRGSGVFRYGCTIGRREPEPYRRLRGRPVGRHLRRAEPTPARRSRRRAEESGVRRPQNRYLRSRRRPALTSAGPFSRGGVRLSLLVGWGSTVADDYLILGGGLGYFILDGLEVGLDYEAWFLGRP